MRSRAQRARLPGVRAPLHTLAQTPTASKPRTSARPQLRLPAAPDRPGPQCIPVFPFPASPRAACSGVSQTRVRWNLGRRPAPLQLCGFRRAPQPLCAAGEWQLAVVGVFVPGLTAQASRQCWAPPAAWHQRGHVLSDTRLPALLPWGRLRGRGCAPGALAVELEAHFSLSYPADGHSKSFPLPLNWK